MLHCLLTVPSNNQIHVQYPVCLYNTYQGSATCRLLCEVHEDYGLNLRLAKHGYWVYDFALPLLILHAVKFKTARNLKHWMRTCPHRQITVLDTHDGMGIDDISGLAPVSDSSCTLGIR